jgi:hypothetical protein
MADTPRETGAVIARISEAVREAELRIGLHAPADRPIFGPEPEGD